MLRVFILFQILIAGASLKAQVLHGIIMADTRDSVIGKGCQKDVQIMREQMEKIARGIGYRQNIIVLVGSDFSKDKLDDTIRQINNQPADIVFLYYSGHGYKHGARKSGFPVMHIEKENEMALNPVLDSLHIQLCAKKGRLTITLGDCCNDFIRARVGERGIPVAKTLSPTSDFYRKLFLESNGNLLICSANTLQVAITDENGSAYTRAFKEALSFGESYSSKSVTWQQLLKDADNRLQIIRGQYPQDHKLLAGKVQYPMYVNDINLITAPGSSDIPANLAYDRVNHYLNTLVDRNTTEKERKYHSDMWTDYFTEDAMADVYVNTTLVEKRPVGKVIEQLYLNASMIASVNFISDLSKVSTDGKKYTGIAIQQIRR